MIYSSKPFTFVEIKNHFIYGFKFDDKPGLFSDNKPPRSIPFSKIEQLNLYLEFLNKVHSEPGFLEHRLILNHRKTKLIFGKSKEL